MSGYEEYKQVTARYRAQYGGKVLVLVEVGTFYGCSENEVDIAAVCELLNIQLTRKDKKTPSSCSDPHMAGFPKVSIEKYLPVLVQTGFVMVPYGQQTDGKKVLARKVTSVQSKATYVQDLSAPSHHNLMCIHVEGIPSRNCNKSVLMAGVAVVDLSTGRCMAGECASRPSDPDLALDEVYRLLTVHTPVEVVLMGRADDLEADALIRRLELKHAGLYNRWRVYDERVEDPDYQNALLGKVYSERGTLSPAEYVGLERQPWALAALTAVLQFLYEQDERVISHIQPPEPLLKEGNMTVSYNTLKQLGIVGAAPEHDSLLKILNRCATAMGKRLFRDRLLNPVSDPEQLAERYRQGRVDCTSDRQSTFVVVTSKRFAGWQRGRSSWTPDLKTGTQAAHREFLAQWPQLLEAGRGIRATAMRHPVIERVRREAEYVPNDLELGTQAQLGVLLYGLNAAGKSSLMKALGSCVVMAQAGMFVPCASFELSPVTQLFSRISTGDDVFKGQSTFTIEMAELRNILHRCDASSLVIGDELCASTEHTSALALVAAGLLQLHEKRCPFIFATHLHDLVDIQEVAALPSLKAFHLTVECDAASGKLKYGRKLTPGAGDTLYSIEVCRSLRRDLPGVSRDLVSAKRRATTASASWASARHAAPKRPRRTTSARST
ncbi:hypothetical protein OEZ85_014477 [Tetradesmus obliquus]|uniref:DNA mismatch repair proteins mutS family domain-containing protein n=1 Tax=Tetradesmus obliquus TaxID=3088 RepID=A0ABY8U9A3_TETOB|nr:hypothetical protein OEZ85_014477 [Tetradesmus obliquus]